MLLRSLNLAVGLSNDTQMIVLQVYTGIIGQVPRTMPISKSQRQWLNKISMYLPAPVFADRQLHVVLSRATFPGSFKTVIRQFLNSDRNMTKNVVPKKNKHRSYTSFQLYLCFTYMFEQLPHTYPAKVGTIMQANVLLFVAILCLFGCVNSSIQILLPPLNT